MNDPMGFRLFTEDAYSVKVAAGIKCTVDPSLPPRTFEFRHPDGRVDRFVVDTEGKVQAQTAGVRNA
jgi:hypothetical protein